MRIISAVIIAAGLLTTPALAASKGSDVMTSCAAAWKTMPAADKSKTTYKAYSTSCMKAGGPTTAAAAPPPMAIKASTSSMSSQDRMKACAAKWDGMKKDGSAKGTTYKAFSSTCLKKS